MQVPDLRQKLDGTVRRERGADAALIDGLRRLYNRGEAKQFADDSFTRAVRGMHEFVDGEYINTAFGDVFVATVKYPKQHQHGTVAMDSLKTVEGDLLHRWCRVPEVKEFDLKRTLFMDTETSGLAGGGGTIPFLISLGFFDQGCFKVKQFFADSPEVEEGMLDLVDEFVKPAKALITFNGKSFDVPQLETRYLLKRRRSPFADLDHIDLLYPSRQLWGGQLPDCQLQTLESKILGFEREDDFPGSEVPAAYFRFLRQGNSDPLYRVFQHNADDIASLSALTGHLWQSLAKPTGAPSYGTALARGRIYRRLGKREEAARSFSDAMESAASGRLWTRAALDLAMIYKAETRWRDAEKLWRRAIDLDDPFRLSPYVELTKYLEHKAKEFEEGATVVEKALHCLPAHRINERHALEHRLRRLLRKTAKAAKAAKAVS